MDPIVKLVHRKPRVIAKPRVTRLSRRQLQVVKRMAQGLSSRDISNELGLSTVTVNTFIRQARIKQSVTTNFELFAKVITQLGISDAEELTLP